MSLKLDNKPKGIIGIDRALSSIGGRPLWSGHASTKRWTERQTHRRRRRRITAIFRALLSPVLSQTFTRFAVQFDRRQRRKKKNSFFKTNNNNVIEQLRREDREPIIDFRNNGEVLLEISKVDCLRRASEKN